MTKNSIISSLWTDVQRSCFTAINTLKKVQNRIFPSLLALISKLSLNNKPMVILPPLRNASAQLSSDTLYREIALKLSMQTIENLQEYPLPYELIRRIPYTFAKKHLILPLTEESSKVLLATHDPLQVDVFEEARMMLGAPVTVIFTPKEILSAAINDSYKHREGAASQFIENFQEQHNGRSDDAIESYDLLDESKEQPPIVKLLNLILAEAILQGASDIHFEPNEEELRVRYRIDGVLHDRHTPASDLKSQLITRLKVMAKMDIAEHRLPQDGRIKLRLGLREIDFRMSTIPIVNGERAVLRILDKSSVVLGLDKIGMPYTVLSEFKRQIDLPEGIILVTGPTGSGKTTTLYSAISDVQQEAVNIMTIEDPVEYRLKGIAQIGVHPKIGLTFASGLRHILRQDPDVIMIGEIRDKETAEIAIQAALTGHLVLSTLHTNDAPSAITRLVDMGIEPYLISSCCLGVLAQRLVRKICPDCKTIYTPLDSELEELRLTRESLIGGVLYRGKGCNSCFSSGFRGRHGIYEYMPITGEIRKQIALSAESMQLKEVAVLQGMMTLHNHGKDLVKQGITTPEEIWRVTRGLDA